MHYVASRSAVAFLGGEERKKCFADVEVMQRS